MTKVWRGKNGTLKIDKASDVTITSANNLLGFFSSATTVATIKDVTVTPPEVTADKVDMIGTTSSFQNAELEKKPVGMAKISGTIVLDSDEGFETEVFASSTAISSPVAATRYQIGNGSEQDVAILVQLLDSADCVQFAMDNAVFKLGDVKITADGHAEQSFEVICLPRDFYLEFYN